MVPGLQTFAGCAASILGPPVVVRGTGFALFERMSRLRISHVAFAAALGLCSVPTAHAAVSGAWSGTLTLAHGAGSAMLAAALTQTGRAASGTVAVQVGDPNVDGSYAVAGKVVGARIRLVGASPGGGRIFLRGVANGDRLTGRGRLVASGQRRPGRVTLVRETTGTDASTCDAVFDQNQAAFAELSAGVLDPICATCHVPGGQAAATRLRITRGDALATARSVSAFVDQNDPAASLLVRKPTGVVVHGGGARVAPGSPQGDLLLRWATLIASAQCLSGSVPTGDPFSVLCASCHGSDGSGLTNAPDIRCSTRSLIAGAVRSGRGVAMPAFTIGELSAADLDAIVNDLAGRCSGAPQDIFASNCARCHGATAGGGTRGPAIGCDEVGELREVLTSGAEGMPAFPSLLNQVGSLGRWLASRCTNGGGSDD